MRDPAVFFQFESQLLYVKILQVIISSYISRSISEVDSNVKTL